MGAHPFNSDSHMPDVPKVWETPRIPAGEQYFVRRLATGNAYAEDRWVVADKRGFPAVNYYWDTALEALASAAEIAGGKTHGF